MTRQSNQAALAMRGFGIRVDLPAEVTGGGGISSRMAEPLQPAPGLLLTCFEIRYDQALGRLH